MMARVPCDKGPCSQAKLRGSDAIPKQRVWILCHEHKLFLINIKKFLLNYLIAVYIN